MNCPKCGNTEHKSVIRIDSRYDPEYKEYFRKNKCVVCDRYFYSVEFEIGLDDRIAQMFAPSRKEKKPNPRLLSSVERYRSYQELRALAMRDRRNKK